MPLYACTVFLSALLLFQVQPMITKIILPWFGGSAAVWITAMLFFQMMLLGGYAYAHWSVGSLPVRKQAALHVLLLIASLAFLPVWPQSAWSPDANATPVMSILYLLFRSVGLPYFLLTTTTPLMQAWYSGSYHAALPYRLFALSNLASLLGLLAYPFLIEPAINLRQQSLWWSAGYAIFAMLILGLALANARRPAASSFPAAEASPSDAAGAMPLREQFLCLLLACCASALMLSVTNHLTQNVASVPFLWIMPLSIYLLSFVLTFDLERLYRRKLFLWLQSLALVAMSYALATWGPHKDIFLLITLFCLGLLVCCIFCHGEVVKRKPHPRYLTSFYLILSIGGALGGVLVGVAAPLALPGYFELPIALTACALLMLVIGYRRPWSLSAAMCLLAALAAVYYDTHYILSYEKSALVMTRNFYGSLRVVSHGEGTPEATKVLFNGAIIHGAQVVAAERRRKPTLYYRPRSGAGRAIASLRPAPLRIGVVGLGAGALASYGERGDAFRFYEINPLVEKLARNDFSYLADSKGKVEVVIGDGRLSMEREPPQRYNLLAVDAFSGDAIPVHLLTVQALQVYCKHLVPDGILALHITNSHLDLELVVEKLARALGKQGVIVVDKGSSGRELSRWALLTDRPITSPEVTRAARPLRSHPELRLWTDDYNNLFDILMTTVSLS